jgi:hypothetical protein
MVVPLTLPAATFPVTDRLESVPTLVMLGWAAVWSVPLTVAAVMAVAEMAFVDRLPAATFPDTARDESVPTDVMLGWLAVWRVPTKLVPVMVLALTLPAVTLPVIEAFDEMLTLAVSNDMRVTPATFIKRLCTPELPKPPMDDRVVNEPLSTKVSSGLAATPGATIREEVAEMAVAEMAFVDTLPALTLLVTDRVPVMMALVALALALSCETNAVWARASVKYRLDPSATAFVSNV